MSPADVRAAWAAAIATLLGAVSLTPVYSSSAWVPPVAAAVLVVLAGGLLLRSGGPASWRRLARGRPAPPRLGAAGAVLVPVAQLYLLGCLLTTLFAPGDAFLGLLPTPTSAAELLGVMREGTAELQEQATPALPLTGLLALTTLLVGGVAVAADLLAVAARQAAVAGVGLLVLSLVPVTTIRGTFGLLPVLAPAAGFALLLWIDQQRRLPVPRRALRSFLVAGAAPAARTGLLALVAALVVGSVLPTLREGTFTTGRTGGGGATGTGLDPVAQLQGQLTLPEPIPLLRLETSVEDPGYLRALTLDVYDSEGGWSMNNLDGETTVADDDRLAPLPPDQTGRRVTAVVQALDHDDLFLPLPTSPLEVQVFSGDAENWRFDAATGTVFGRGATTAGLTYAVSAAEPRPSPEALAAVGELPRGDPVLDRFITLPELDPSVSVLAGELVAGAASPYERVRRIHAYLTDRSEGFVYSLSTEQGTSGDDLVDFLRLRRGYCEQYAGTMAVLVRAAGVPARVALGYTPGSVERGGTRLVTSDDAHAWVEAYFDGLGWVPFDPTPIALDRAVDLPWAPRTGVQQDTDVAPVPAPVLPPQAGQVPREDRAGEAVPETAQRAPVAVLPRVLAGAGLALLLAVLGAVPAALRERQRRRRLTEGTAGGLWDELAASAQDVGLRHDPTWTPRRTAQEFGDLLLRSGTEAGPAGAEAVRRLALAEEAASYGPAGSRASEREDLLGALDVARRALLRSAPRDVRLRARLWPPSLIAGSGTRLAEGISRRLSAGRWLGPARTAGGGG